MEFSKTQKRAQQPSAESLPTAEGEERQEMHAAMIAPQP
jgi:hypothetical protein